MPREGGASSKNSEDLNERMQPDDWITRFRG